MRFNEIALKGAFVIESEQRFDVRGSFFRTFCAEEFHSHGLSGQFQQCGISTNTARGTLRGMHLQKDPKSEAKLVRCLKGAIYDVIVDLRRESATFRQWFSIQLTESSPTSLYVPVGFAHGFLTLRNDTDVFYQITEPYAAELSTGVRWNDPAFAILWPEEIAVISDRDRNYPDFR